MDRGAATSLGAQLQDQLREAIRSGRLGEDERLPSTRVLARELDVSRGLVVDAYAQLEAEGYLATRTGSATRVACTTAATRPARAPRPAPQVLDVDFRYGVPDLSSFPMRDWMWALGEAARERPFTAGGYGDRRGVVELREVVAAYLRRVRGAAATADDLVICSGFAQGLGLVMRALGRAGATRVAVEDPRSLDNDPIVERAGIQVVPIPVDERGIDTDAVISSGAQAVILTPAHQAPTGTVLAPERRTALVAWAMATGATIIEDDYDAEFRYDRQPVGSMQGLAPDHVVAIGSVSKSLAPAMRLGWIACPARFTESIAEEKEYADRGSPGLDQEALARLIRSGRYDRHLRRIRSVYGARRAALAEAMAEHAPGVELGGLAAGIHAVIHLPPGSDEQHVVDAARGRGVGVYAMSTWRTDGAGDPPQLVVGFGNVHEAAVRRGIATIGDLLTGMG